MLNAFPEGPPLTLKVPLTINHFPDSHNGRLTGEAGILTSALLQGGFINDLDLTHTFSTLPCPSWLHLVANLTYNMAHGLSIAHEPTNLHNPPLTNLDDKVRCTLGGDWSHLGSPQMVRPNIPSVLGLLSVTA
jgi:hypothetical protein